MVYIKMSTQQKEEETKKIPMPWLWNTWDKKTFSLLDSGFSMAMFVFIILLCSLSFVIETVPRGRVFEGLNELLHSKNGIIFLFLVSVIALCLSSFRFTYERLTDFFTLSEEMVISSFAMVVAAFAFVFFHMFCVFSSKCNAARSECVKDCFVASAPIAVIALVISGVGLWLSIETYLSDKELEYKNLETPVPQLD